MKKKVYVLYTRPIIRNRDDWYRLIWDDDELRAKRRLKEFSYLIDDQEFKIETEIIDLEELKDVGNNSGVN